MIITITVLPVPTLFSLVIITITSMPLIAGVVTVMILVRERVRVARGRARVKPASVCTLWIPCCQSAGVQVGPQSSGPQGLPGGTYLRTLCGLFSLLLLQKESIDGVREMVSI